MINNVGLNSNVGTTTKLCLDLSSDGTIPNELGSPSITCSPCIFSEDQDGNLKGNVTFFHPLKSPQKKH